MIDASDVLQRMLSAPKIAGASLASVPTDQGVYVLWLAEEAPVCLKVGIAGPRGGRGLRARLGNHYSSNTASSVLARHLAADCTSRWCRGRDFTNREQRQAFLKDECFFQAVIVRTDSRRELEQIEARVIARLQPAYVGRVGMRALASPPDRASMWRSSPSTASSGRPSTT
jgi:hypothetical protein